MGIQYVNSDWQFDAQAWSEALNAAHPADLLAAKELSGIGESGWRNWLKGEVTQSYKQPGMKNFLAICNMLDLDPRQFWTL